MIYDGLISVSLPARLGPPVATGWLEGLERLLFEGRWGARRATCGLSSAAALAGVYAAVRGLDPVAVEVDSDADEALSLSMTPATWGAAPPPWPELLPPAWTAGPCAFRLRARLARPQLTGAITLRFTPRHDPAVGALVGALRLAWAPAADTETPDRPASLRASVDGAERLGRLEARLSAWGEALGAQLEAGLLESLDGARVRRDGRAVVLWGIGDAPGRFAEVTAGLEGAAAGLAASAASAARAGAWAAVGPDGGRGRVTGGAFESVAEVGR
jgi:hypothetical protein